MGFANLCIEDEIEIYFNGELLPIDQATITDERATRILARFRTPVDAPEAFGAHWFRFHLDPTQGQNTLEIKTLNQEKTATFLRTLNGLELKTQFKDFTRPEGLETDRVPPTAP